jgi:diguanylate cyclase
MNLRLPPPLVDFLLGPPGHLRVRVSQTLLSLVVFTAFAGVLHGQVMAGMIPLARASALTVFNLGGAFLFYLLIRSGLSLRMSSDPALTLPQCTFAMVAIIWSYAITGPARGAVMMILLLVIFFGMFALSPRQARGLGGFSLGLLAAVMAWRVHSDPGHYDPRVEVVHFVYATIVIIAVSTLSIRLGRLRNRLSRQKKELQEALERIQTLATRDALTGLLNRRAMLEALTHEAQRVQRGGGPMCLALIDLDHFKRINDTHGHAAGDRVLRGFADIAREELRATDVLSRWGGEEFMLLLPATGVPAALVCIERVRIRLADTPFDDIAPGLTATFSAGFAQCQGEADLEHAIERADQAMYKAKAEGRNRTLCLDPGPAPSDAGAGATRHPVLP